MNTERTELFILDVLNAAPTQLFPTPALHRDVNGLSPQVITRIDLDRALDAMEEARPPQIIRVDGTEKSQGRLTRIMPAGIARLACAPRD